MYVYREVVVVAVGPAVVDVGEAEGASNASVPGTLTGPVAFGP